MLVEIFYSRKRGKVRLKNPLSLPSFQTVETWKKGHSIRHHGIDWSVVTVTDPGSDQEVLALSKWGRTDNPRDRDCILLLPGRRFNYSLNGERRGRKSRSPLEFKETHPNDWRSLLLREFSQPDNCWEIWDQSGPVRVYFDQSRRRDYTSDATDTHPSQNGGDSDRMDLPHRDRSKEGRAPSSPSLDHPTNK